MSEVTCGSPEPMRHVVMTTKCIHHGCVAQYRCDVGYQGNARESRCMFDGTWTLVSVNCSSTSFAGVTCVMQAYTQQNARTHARTHARTSRKATHIHAHAHAHTHTLTHTHTHTHRRCQSTVMHCRMTLKGCSYTYSQLSIARYSCIQLSELEQCRVKKLA